MKAGGDIDNRQTNQDGEQTRRILKGANFWRHRIFPNFVGIFLRGFVGHDRCRIARGDNFEQTSRTPMIRSPVSQVRVDSNKISVPFLRPLPAVPPSTAPGREATEYSLLRRGLGRS
jgi:hypothetical protein